MCKYAGNFTHVETAGIVVVVVYCCLPPLMRPYIWARLTVGTAVNVGDNQTTLGASTDNHTTTIGVKAVILVGEPSLCRMLEYEIVVFVYVLFCFAVDANWHLASTILNSVVHLTHTRKAHIP